MAVLLEQDQEQPVQAHLDELTWRTTVLFTAVAVLTLAWSTVVNDVLHLALISLQPCPGDCLNVYDPAQWSAVRWLTSLLLALLSALPLVAFHVLQFAKPGLLPSEYTALRRWMLVSILTLVFLSVVLMTHVLPALYEMGYQQHRKAGLAAQYSAIDMLLVAAYCVWSLMVIAATWTGLVVMGGWASSTSPRRMSGVCACMAWAPCCSFSRFPTTHSRFCCPFWQRIGPPQNWSVSDGCSNKRWPRATHRSALMRMEGASASPFLIAPATVQTFTTDTPPSRAVRPSASMHCARPVPTVQHPSNTWFRHASRTPSLRDAMPVRVQTCTKRTCYGSASVFTGSTPWRFKTTESQRPILLLTSSGPFKRFQACSPQVLENETSLT